MSKGLIDRAVKDDRMCGMLWAEGNSARSILASFRLAAFTDNSRRRTKRLREEDFRGSSVRKELNLLRASAHIEV